MKYNQPVAVVSIQTGKKIDFLVPAQLAMLLFWFLSSQTAKVTALVCWHLTNDLAFYIQDWLTDLQLIWQAINYWQGWLSIFGEVAYGT